MSDSDKLSSRLPFKRRRIGGLAIILLSVVAGLLIVFARTRSGGAVGSSGGHPETPTAHNEVILACPGRVEGLSELVEVGSGIDGILGQVLVKEVQHVTAGQVLAVIDWIGWIARFSQGRLALSIASGMLRMEEPYEGFHGRNKVFTAVIRFSRP
jgi:hypothetical protein